jgi:hypothetical protein
MAGRCAEGPELGFLAELTPVGPGPMRAPRLIRSKHDPEFRNIKAKHRSAIGRDDVAQELLPE